MKNKPLLLISLFWLSCLLPVPKSNGAEIEVNLPVKNEPTHQGIRQVSGESNRYVRELALQALKDIKDEEDLSLVSKLVNDPIPTVRRSALQTLPEIGGKKVEGRILQESLSDENTQVIREALRSIKKLEIKEAEKAIILLLGHKEGLVRKEAIRTLGDLRSRAAVSKFKPRFNSVSVGEKVAVISALSKVGNKEAIQILIPLLEDAHPYLKGAAVEALGKTSYQISEEQLKKLLRDKHYFVLKKTLEYLEKRKEERLLLPQIINLLSHDDISVKTDACKLLGEYQDSETVSNLIGFIESKEGRPFLQRKAAEALVQIGTREVDDYFIVCLGQVDPKLRQISAWALGELKSSEGVSFLVEALGDKKEEVKIEAFQALGKIKDPKATPGLLKILKQEDSEDQKRAVETLGEIGDNRVVDSLIVILEGEEDKLKSTVAEALGKIGDRKAVEPLIAILSQYKLPYPVREKAIGALWQLKAKEAVPAIMKLVTEKVIKPEMGDMLIFDSGTVRMMGLQALAELGSAELVPKILETINANPSSKKLEKVAAETLTELTGEIYLFRPYIHYPEFFLESMAPASPLPYSCKQKKGVFRKEEVEK